MFDPAHPLTLWLARASMACYAAAVLVSVSRRGASPKEFPRWRVLWSMACLLLIVHVLAAFHFEHSWSHTAALRHTAEQTARVTGIDWGGGLYFNYAFLILWFLDVVFLWKNPVNRRSQLRRLTNLACVFMIVNATVVFGPRWWFWPCGAVGLAAIAIRQRSHSETQAGNPETVDVSDTSPDP
jgi:hypothetical protein